MNWYVAKKVMETTQILTLIYMGYFDNLFYMGGGAKSPPV